MTSVPSDEIDVAQPSLNTINRVLLAALLADKFSVEELKLLTKQPEDDSSLVVSDSLANIQIVVTKCAKKGPRRHVHVRITSHNFLPIQARLGLKDFKCHSGND